MISEIMIGIPNVISPVHSITITVSEMVMRTVPPSWHAAPIRMYLAMFVPCEIKGGENCKVKVKVEEEDMGSGIQGVLNAW